MGREFQFLIYGRTGKRLLHLLAIVGVSSAANGLIILLPRRM
ncbi:hypothetical protein SLEP1_g44180 [Rubroshorea leprosula]|uniref:Uncharacterized protein n=1 Tax=Rubroshorea leprosula TaxID=152421 RepID=A0AAV5LFE1_9ROSI|nr:hypothetical protein SLEP1_g44180 [Rubroshorea leprosula]